MIILNILFLNVNSLCLWFFFKFGLFDTSVCVLACKSLLALIWMTLHRSLMTCGDDSICLRACRWCVMTVVCLFVCVDCTASVACMFVTYVVVFVLYIFACRYWCMYEDAFVFIFLCEKIKRIKITFNGWSNFQPNISMSILIWMICFFFHLRSRFLQLAIAIVLWWCLVTMILPLICWFGQCSCILLRWHVSFVVLFSKFIFLQINFHMLGTPVCGLEFIWWPSLFLYYFHYCAFNSLFMCLKISLICRHSKITE